MTSAYINVLNAVNKNLGLPKYPKFGLQRQRRGILDMTPIKQIRENLRQLGDSLSQVGQLVTRVVSTAGEDSRKTVLKQFQKFTDLWSNQLNEISRMLEPQMLSALEARDDVPSAPTQETVLQQVNRRLSQISKDVTNYIDNILTGIRDRIFG